jgi:hypothetical protein
MYNESQMLGFQHLDMLYVLCISSVGILTYRQDLCIMSLKCRDFNVWTRYSYNDPQVLGFQHVDKIYV